MRRLTVTALTCGLLVGGAVLAGCGADGTAATRTEVVTARPTPSTSTGSTASRSAAADCAHVRKMHRHTDHITVTVPTCLSFDGYSDIEAVIDTVRSTRPAVLRQLDPLTFRARAAGDAVLVVRSTREVCTASSACAVPNPPHRIAVTVTGD